VKRNEPIAKRVQGSGFGGGFRIQGSGFRKGEGGRFLSLYHFITLSPCRPARRFSNCVMLLAALALSAAGCAPMSFLITPVPVSRDLVESEVLRESLWASQKIALVDIDGVLQNDRPSSLLTSPGENPVSFFQEKIDKAAHDKNVRAVVLRINSPGGGVTASDIMYTEVLRLKQRTGKPVIACMLDVAASGGYYIACAADKIYAQPTTVTGSIGVIMIAPDFTGTMQKLGIRANVIKSAEMKDAGSPFREMNEKDRAVFQGMIDAMYARFLKVVERGRPGLDAAEIKRLADGRVYLAPDAREAGLIDEIGTLTDALAAAKAAAGLEREKVVVVEYARPLAHRPNIYARTADAPAEVNLINVDLPGWLNNAAPRFMYLWAPGW
jgi:protease IV